MRENYVFARGHVGAMIALAVARPVIGSTEESGTWMQIQSIAALIRGWSGILNAGFVVPLACA